MITVSRVTAFTAATSAFLFIVAAPSSSAAQDGNPQLLTVSCSGCHGPGGHSPGEIPSIYGRTAESLAETLRRFRDGTRPGTVMPRISKGYSDSEIETVAREIAANWK